MRPAELVKYFLRRKSSIALLYASAMLFLLVATSVPLAPHAAASTNGPGLLIPLYMYPSSTWNTVIQEKQANPSIPFTVIVNPDSGPGSSVSQTYATYITSLRNAGITVIGYISTEYAAVSLSSVESQIAAYKSMYDVNGIFLDQMSNVNGEQSYYSSATDYAQSEGFSTVVGNPGTDVPSSFVGTVSVLLVFENPALPTTSRLSSITMGDPASDFAVMSYDVASISSSEVSTIASYASYIYITNGETPNPYGILPSYFSSLVSDVASMTVTAPAPSSSDPTITVKSVTSSGSALNGMYTTVSYNGKVVDSGFTPLVYSGPAGNPYTVCVDNYQSYTFAHWDDGLTNSCRVFGLSQNLVLTATYNT
jgi:Spherulation-specific family 4